MAQWLLPRLCIGFALMMQGAGLRMLKKYATHDGKIYYDFVYFISLVNTHLR